MDGKVIVLATGYDPEGDQAVVTREQSGPCLHREVNVVEARGVLVCRRCDEEVPAIEWILRLSRDWQWYSTRVEQAKRRAKDAEDAAERRIAESRRQASRQTRGIPMPIGKRLARIASSIGRAQGDLAGAFVSLATVHETGRLGLAPHYLDGAAEHIQRARSSIEKLVNDYGTER